MRIINLLFLIAFIFLSGCLPSSNTFNPTSSLPIVTFTPTSGPTVQRAQAYRAVPTEIIPYPYPGIPYPIPSVIVTPPVFDSPTVTISASTPTITPTLTSTSTLPAYTGKPFSIVFIRDGNLWLTEIGGKGEQQLTHESEDWWVYRFDINRKGDRIAYVALKGQFPDVVNGMIKQFDFRTGQVSPLVGMEDQLLEDRVKWLDDTHLAYTYTEYPAKDIDTPADPIPAEEYHPYNYIVVVLNIGAKRFITDAVDISQSPDGRYLVTCLSGYVYEPSCEFHLFDQRTNQTYIVAEDSSYGWFKGWSSDSKWMLFANATYGHMETDRKYLIVDPVSRSGNWVLLPGASWGSTSWAFHSSVVACNICESGNDCQIRFWGPGGNQTRQSISLRQQFWDISWTPDDKRLVLASPDHALWIINIDGTGLSRILNNVKDWAVLAKNGY